MTLDMTLREQILMRLVDVIDPETGVDVLRMRLVEGLSADEKSGVVTYLPLSPFVAAVPLGS